MPSTMRFCGRRSTTNMQNINQHILLHIINLTGHLLTHNQSPHPQMWPSSVAVYPAPTINSHIYHTTITAATTNYYDVRQHMSNKPFPLLDLPISTCTLSSSTKTNHPLISMTPRMDEFANSLICIRLCMCVCLSVCVSVFVGRSCVCYLGYRYVFERSLYTPKEIGDGLATFDLADLIKTV